MIIGVMGHSGSGKSTFCEELKNKGAYIIDADKIGKDILKKGSSALDKVIDAFGEEYLNPDKSLNRKKLGETVFKDKKRLETLNSITWGEIEKEIEKEIEENKDKLIILDCPLLLEIETYKKCDEVIFIDVPKDVLIKRITKRDNISEETAKNRIESQSCDFKSKATIIIKNDNLDDLKNKAKSLMKGWIK